MTIMEVEKDITVGDLKALPSGDYDLVVFMKLQFFFENSSNYKWNGAQKALFMKNWENQIKKAWDGCVIRFLSKGKKYT